MPRVKVYEAEDLARGMVKTFNDRDVEYVEKYRWKWPRVLQNVGDSLAVAYGSDKWQRKNDKGARPGELYKHLAESRNRAFVKPGLLHDYYKRNKKWKVIGPKVYFDEVPMPDSFAILGLFEEINLKLYTGGDDDDPKFGRGRDDGIVKSTVRHGYLGASKFRWSEVGCGKDEPFIFVFTKSEGPLMLVTGKTLDIEKDGIVG